MDVVGHRLVGAIEKPAAAIGGEISPSLLIIHYTGSQSGKGTISWFESPASKVSAHLVVDVDGTVTQMVPFDRKASHAGRSRWRDREGCNAFSVGIEIVNPGPLKRLESGTWVDLLGQPWTGPVLEADHQHGHPEHRFWAEFGVAQVARVQEICRALVAAYDIQDIVGHDDVAPQRKLDPGPAFPLASLRALLRAPQEAHAEA